jgi:phage FluMu protein gp41
MSTQQIRGTLTHGLLINGIAQREFVLREYITGDIFDAELDVDADKPLAFSAALLVRQLVSIGTFEGPFTINMIRSLHPADFSILRSKQRELEKTGELSGSDEKAS